MEQRLVKRVAQKRSGRRREVVQSRSYGDAAAGCRKGTQVNAEPRLRARQQLQLFSLKYPAFDETSETIAFPAVLSSPAAFPETESQPKREAKGSGH